MTDDFDRRKEDLLARVDLVELADALGLQPAGKKVRYCPAHPDVDPPDLRLYPDHAHCFVCGFNADAFALVAKVKGLDFVGAFDFLAARYGLPLIQDLRKSEPGKGRGLGYGKGAKVRGAYPKPPPAAPLPPTPSPTLGEPVATVELDGRGAALGNGDEGEGASAYPNSLPGELAADFDDFVTAWSYFHRPDLEDYRRRLYRDPTTGRFRVADEATAEAAAQGLRPAAQEAAQGLRRSRRVEVFAALLDQATPASTTAAGDWLEREKGITKATQDRFRLAFLDDPKAAAVALVKTFGLDDLLALGIYGKGKGGPYFVFRRHRLLFPFTWKGEIVDVQGRDVEATDKGDRFRNTGGRNPIPFNAGALVEAREKGEPVFLCEGATDTLTLAQSGRHAVGIVGTGGFKADWLPAFRGLKVYLAFDADEAGRKAAVAVTKVFFDAGLPAPKVVNIPAGFKDVNELFRGNQA